MTTPVEFTKARGTRRLSGVSKRFPALPLQRLE